LSVLGTDHLYPLENIPCTHSCWSLNPPQGHSRPRRIMRSKISTEKIGNGTRDLPACSAVAQPTAPPRAIASNHSNVKFRFGYLSVAKFNNKQNKSKLEFILSYIIYGLSHVTTESEWTLINYLHIFMQRNPS
jgi:hypothetical protein